MAQTLTRPSLHSWTPPAQALALGPGAGGGSWWSGCHSLHELWDVSAAGFDPLGQGPMDVLSNPP